MIYILRFMGGCAFFKVESLEITQIKLKYTFEKKRKRKNKFEFLKRKQDLKNSQLH